MERALYFTKYRNIGLREPQRLVLNNITDSNEMGNLVILIGANNSGKSNVLDALESFGKRRISERDVTDNSYEEKDRKPQLSLSCKDVDEYTYRIEYQNEARPFVVYPESEQESFISDKSELKELRNAIADLLEKYNIRRGIFYNNQHDILSRLSALSHKVNSATEDLGRVTEETIQEIDAETEDVMRMLLRICAQNGSYQQWWQSFVDLHKHEKFVQTSRKINEPREEKVNRLFKEKYKTAFLPSIVRYIDEPIKQENIVTDRARIKSNSFFVSVFQAIDYSIDTLMNAYDRFGKNYDKGILITQEKEINRRLKKVSDDFNRLYYFDETPYKFKISLESSNIYFYICEGDKSITLNYQSVGFRWFFDLYFNLLSVKTLAAGDIIIMDEPATNLHVAGQRELRRFLKQFAIKNKITVVLATHSPFLIDIDYLDEIRVVETKDGEAFIKNDFSAIDLDDPDSLLPVKQALTVNSCHLYDPDKTVVFVEGITDYNYLLAFKNILEVKEDIIFLPIKGIGKETDEKKQKAISKKLITLRKQNPILLVDGDSAGKSIQKLNAEDSALKVVSLTDIDTNFKTIESLFDKGDLAKHGLLDGEGKYIKHASTSANIKTFYEEKKFSQATKANFKKLFGKLKEIAD